MTHLSVWLITLVVWCYWLSVLVMIARSRWRLGAASGTVPRSLRERWMWMAWVPTVFGWLSMPILAYTSRLPLLRAPQWALETPYRLLAWPAVVAAVVAYVMTVPCWLQLGTNWSLAIVPEKQTSLVTRGFYARVRHPIYALGLLLMAATWIAAPSLAMTVVAASHLALVLLKVGSEERYLMQRHGVAYQDYCQQTRRFVPLPSSADERAAA